MERSRSTDDPAWAGWSQALSDLYRRELGLKVTDLPELPLEEAYRLRLTPDSAFDELVLASLRLGRFRAAFRLFGRRPPEGSHRPFTAEDQAAETDMFTLRDSYVSSESSSPVHSPQPSETSMPNWVDFSEIRRRVSLQDVLFRYYQITTLKREGDKLIGPCPVHGGDSPRAFHADLGKNVWHCFSKCQGGGNQLDFVAKKEGINIRDAALKLQAFFQTEGSQIAGTPAGVSTPTATPATTPTNPTAPPTTRPAASNVDPVATTATPTPPAAAATTAPSAPATPATSPSRPSTNDSESNVPLTFTLQLKADHPHLVTERALKPETIASFGIGYCSKGTLRGQIAIPIHDEDGDLVAYAGRRLKPSDIREHGKYTFPKGFKKARVLYRYHVAKEKKAEAGLILVEGFFACLKLCEAGLTQVVAAMGVEVSPYQANLIQGAKDLTVIFDGDEAGHAGADKIREQLGSILPVRIIRLPAGVKPDDCPPRLLRWLVNGVGQLDLSEVSYSPRMPTITAR